MQRRPRRRPMYFQATCLRDGTVLAAYVVRKPTPHVIKRDGLRIDADNVCKELVSSGTHLLSDTSYNGRTRFQDILSNSLNVRRALRDLLLPRLAAVESELAAMRDQLQRIEDAISTGSRSDTVAYRAWRFIWHVRNFRKVFIEKNLRGPILYCKAVLQRKIVKTPLTNSLQVILYSRLCQSGNAAHGPYDRPNY